MEQEKIHELVNKSRQGEMSAFALLVTEFQPLVFRIAFRLLCNEDEAKDMVQDTFVKVWLAVGRFDGGCRFSTWIYKITCNTCYDRMRMLRHSPLDNYPDSSIPFNLVSGDNIEVSVANKQLAELILRYTDELSPMQRLIFTLRDVEGFEVTEVEEITGLSAEKIKNNLYLARKNIRNKMNKIDPDL